VRRYIRQIQRAVPVWRQEVMMRGGSNPGIDATFGQAGYRVFGWPGNARLWRLARRFLPATILRNVASQVGRWLSDHRGCKCPARFF